MAEERSFLGRGWGFPPRFERGAVAMSADEEDIRGSLHILLATDIGERVMQPKYGCDLRRLLFEPLDATLNAYVKDLVTNAILYFEPRILLERVTLTPEAAEGRVLIELAYTVAGTNTRGNYVYPFYLGEGAEVPR